MTNRGYFLIARGMLAHPRFAPNANAAFTNAEAWIWLIEAAAFKSRHVPVQNGTRRQIVKLEPGQLSYSVRYLAAAWRWSDKRVQRFLRALVDDGSVTIQTTTGQTMITLCNWEKYQKPYAETTTQTTTATTTQTPTNKKEGKESKKNMRVSAVGNDGFEEWYAAYPRKKQLNDARRAYRKIIDGKLISHADLMARTRLFAAERARRPVVENRFIPYPASWLNSGEYRDEPETLGFRKEPSTIAAPTKTAADFTDADWRKRLEHRSKGNLWPVAQWGPEPGQPGCFVPSHLIVCPVELKAAGEAS